MAVSDVVILMGLVAELTPTSGVICQGKLANLGAQIYLEAKNKAPWLRWATWVVFSVAGQGYRSGVRAGNHACKI